MEEKTGWKKWFSRIVDLVNPFRDPSLTVAAVLTFVEEVGQHDAWYWVVVVALLNWLAVRGVVWLVVNFTFASTFLARRLWWALRHPRLAWRILDAVGHEEIVIGGLSAVSEATVLQDGSMSPVLGSSGVHVLGELPAGTELPLLGLANGQVAPDLSAFTASGMFGGVTSSIQGMYLGQQTMSYAQLGNSSYVSPQSTDGLPQSFPQVPQRPSQEEERLRAQLESYVRLLDDWIQFTEEKWRTISDSQLGWKPLRGRWGSWDDIFQDAYAAKTSDPMAEAAQAAGEATARRFEASREKGSAASSVACFMRDMMTLRRSIELLQQAEATPDTPIGQPTVRSFPQNFGTQNANGNSTNGTTSGSLGSNGFTPPRNTLIRRPAQIFVDAGE